ncbi:short-chain dehydrogenase/reductase [Enemella dayhoffiae]|uniref:Short-chain dehydrogenase/reductase n=1 Tax=Enemella dayhoffiae TaxID=2016507 RepID=A0A255HBU9_9ACTN|nr:SDR family NAD(P)-dependent oxidoreductase [Enemella dayhoffiae]OYO25161.1 short-chain dehydrogenase/reductase [Enemella dayhoffiae]
MSQPTPPAHVLVTGATSGIGAEVARLLSAQGFRVSGAGRRTELVPPGVTPVSLDLTDEASIHRAHAEATAESGPVEVLVNAAGLGQFGAIEDVTLAQARRQLEVNVLGQLELTRRCLPGMRAAGRGRVVMVSSLAGEFAAPMCGWYHASKFALEALSDSLRMETDRHGIEVVVVQPGPVDTPWHEQALLELRQTSGGGAYAEAAAGAEAYLTGSQMRQVTSTIAEVAAAVVGAATTPRPAPRIRVGRGARMAVAMSRLLPTRTFDRLTRQQFGC